MSEETYYHQINDDIAAINPTAWHPIALNDELPALGIETLEYCIDNNTRPQIRLTFKDKPEQNKIDRILNHKLLKPKEKEKLKTRLQEGTEESRFIEYTGSSFSQNIKEKLFPALEEFYRQDIS